jgi:hypothetical protein
MTTHEFDTYLDVQSAEHFDPPYHEQLLMMQEFEESRNNALKNQGAIDALQNLTVTLSALCLREDVKGDYYFGMHDALEIVKGNLDVVRGGVL